MNEDETLYSLCTEIYQNAQKKTEIPTNTSQLDCIDNSKECKQYTNKESFKNEESEMPNHPIIDTEVAAPSLASLEFETKFAQLFIKEFMSLKENLEDFLEENYIYANKRLVSISQGPEINKLKRSIEKSIQPRSKEFQKCLTLNVKNVPSISSLIPSSEISLYLNSNLPKTLGSYINKKKNTTIYIKGETRLSINLRDNEVYIKESETIKPTALVLIEGIKVLESYDRFRVGTTILIFDLKFEQSIELRCTKENGRQILHKWDWDDHTALLIGRGKNNSIAFPEDIKMSKSHFTIEFFEGNWVIINKGSKNGVWNYLHNKRTMAGKKESMEVQLFESSQFYFQGALFEVKSFKID